MTRRKRLIARNVRPPSGRKGRKESERKREVEGKGMLGQILEEGKGVVRGGNETIEERTGKTWKGGKGKVAL